MNRGGEREERPVGGKTPCGTVAAHSVFYSGAAHSLHDGETSKASETVKSRTNSVEAPEVRKPTGVWH